MEAYKDLIRGLRHGLSSVLQGKPEAVDLALAGIFAGGHLLLEDVPGVGKTTLARALAKAFGVTFSRVQFTPDLLPGDITGGLVLAPENGTFSFRRGPVFTNVLLADEINRASPRTQAALLEAMNEAQVTVDGETHALDRPFVVIATQNPADYQGTYPLPEAQLDRFLVRFSIGYPSAPDELLMLMARRTSDPIDDLSALCSKSELIDLQRAVREIEVKPIVAGYMLAVVQASRTEPALALGVSPRGSLALFRAAQSRAFLDGRDFVTPKDVQEIAPATLSHRVTVRDEARYGGATDREIITRLLATVRVPV